MSRKWTAEEDALIQEYAAKGLSYSLLAKRLGVTRSTICGRAFRIGVVSAKPGERQRNGGKAGGGIAREVVRLRNDGLSYDEIIELTGARYQTAVSACYRARKRAA
mgnify:CR=1 FL=1